MIQENGRNSSVESVPSNRIVDYELIDFDPNCSRAYEHIDEPERFQFLDPSEAEDLRRRFVRELQQVLEDPEHLELDYIIAADALHHLDRSIIQNQ